MFLIDARTAADWSEHLAARNERFVRELRKDPTLDVSVFASRVAFNFIGSLRDLGRDERERSHLVEHAAHGISHAVVQSLLWEVPPPIHPDSQVH